MEMWEFTGPRTMFRYVLFIGGPPLPQTQGFWEIVRIEKAAAVSTQQSKMKENLTCQLTYQPLLTGRCLLEGSGRTQTPRSTCRGSGRVVGRDSLERAAVCCWHRLVRSQSPHSCRHIDVCSWAETSHHCGKSRRPGRTSDPLELQHTHRTLDNFITVRGSHLWTKSVAQYMQKHSFPFLFSLLLFTKQI